MLGPKAPRICRLCTTRRRLCTSCRCFVAHPTWPRKCWANLPHYLVFRDPTQGAQFSKNEQWVWFLNTPFVAYSSTNVQSSCLQGGHSRTEDYQAERRLHCLARHGHLQGSLFSRLPLGRFLGVIYISIIFLRSDLGTKNLMDQVKRDLVSSGTCCTNIVWFFHLGSENCTPLTF